MDEQTRERGMPEDDRHQIFKNRNKLIQQHCSDHFSTNSSLLGSNTIYVDPVHRIYYCPIQKVASTFWKIIILLLSGYDSSASPFNMTLRDDQRKTQTVSPESLSNALQSGGEAFFFVRDPYARLFSCYEDKLYYANPIFWKTIGSDIVSTIRGNSEAGRSRYGYDVTFSEFIKYVLYKHQSKARLDVHFRPMHKFCNPCQTQYNYIGHLETFAEDATYILSKWRQQFDDVTIKIDDIHHQTGLRVAVNKLHNLFEMKKLLPDKTFPFIKLLLRAWRSLQIRGYLSKDIKFPFHGDVSDITSEDVAKVMTQALNTPQNITAVKLQRAEALLQAYRQVPLEDMELLRKFVLTDCLLFGYDDRPASLFNKLKPTGDEFLYLDGISDKV
ncbi:hypothetical protein ACF0H5_010592 [Mactra antiquata]